MKKHQQNRNTLLKTSTLISVCLAFTLVALACSTSDDTDRLNEANSVDVDEFPDSTTLHSDLDTLNFAKACEEMGEFDIASRYYKYLTNSWKGSEDHTYFASQGYIGLAFISKKKEKIDTNLVLTYLDSAIMVSPYGSQHMARAMVLFDFEMDSVEYYLNQSYLKNHPLDVINGFVRENLDYIDTNKLEFDWKRLY